MGPSAAWFYEGQLRLHRNNNNNNNYYTVSGIPTKIHLFQASILLYASETWTLRVTDMNTLEDFYWKRLWQILVIRWHQHRTNSEIPSHASVGPLAEQITR